jgi:ParB family chromosome partitioning protein
VFTPRRDSQQIAEEKEQLWRNGRRWEGLSALIPDVPEPIAPPNVPNEVDIDLISPNEHQPRHHLDDTRLDELARSIRAHGVIQPIVVRKVDGGYRIIAGERRWRSAQRAGLLRVPVVIKDVGAGNDAQTLEMALIENIQREDLNPIDEAAPTKNSAPISR